jgi:hypothetical protein
MENANDENQLNQEEVDKKEEQDNNKIEIENEPQADNNINNEENDINEIKEDENNKDKNDKKDDKSNFLKNIPMYIYQAKVLEINPANLLVYFIKGTLIEKKIVRSFVDLELFRDALKASWPCTYVPNFPLRKDTPEENEKIISEEKKMKLLNHFLKQISESSYLCQCAITKTFISNSADYATAASKIKKESYMDISEKYLETFKDYVYDQRELDKKTIFIKNFVKTLQSTLSRFLVIGTVILKEMFNIKREQNTINYLADMFTELEQAMPNKKKRLTNLKETLSPIYSVSNIYFNI